MHQTVQSTLPPTHAERLLDMQNRVSVLEILVEQLVSALAAHVGVNIPGLSPEPTPSPSNSFITGS